MENNEFEFGWEDDLLMDLKAQYGKCNLRSEYSDLALKRMYQGEPVSFE